MEQNVPVSENIKENNKSNTVISNEYYFIKKVKPPNLDESLFINYNTILNKIRTSKIKNKKLIVGVIKFIDNENIEYIHCPILKLKDNNNEDDNDMCIGVCNHFESVVNNLDGKKHLASHKYQYHCKCNKRNSKVQIFLKTKENIQNTLEKYMNKQKILKNEEV